MRVHAHWSRARLNESKKVIECDGVSGQLPVLPAPRLSIWSGKNRLLPRELSETNQAFTDKVYNVRPCSLHIWQQSQLYFFILKVAEL
jgi:hypothetical protein